MNTAKNGLVYWLSLVIAVLTTAAALGGLLLDDLYRDNLLVTTSWIANDLITLVVAVPLLLLGIFWAWRGSIRGYLVLLGLVDYTLYNFAFYQFGAAFNKFFMLYPAITALSILVLIFGLTRIDAQEISRQFHRKTPTKWIAGFMVFVGLSLTSVYFSQYLSFLTTGDLPRIVTAVEHPTNVIFALDLTLVVPWLLIGGVWLWRGRPWGYIVATIVNIKGAVYMLALSTVTVAVVQAGISDNGTELFIWGGIGVGSLIASLLLLVNLRTVKAHVVGERKFSIGIESGR
ncbi:MAG: hypothetical protein QNJ45_15775 [Ardenticatenaceae bacterium]|nr:hypothetical protein [Ardenticatenaceae bacterium]